MDKKTLFAVFALFALAAQVTALSYGAITIYKFNDTNGNGIKDKAEKGMAGSFTIQGTNGYNRVITISQNNMLSAAIVLVPYGATYTVTENVPAGYVSTTKNPQTALIKTVYKCNATACGAAVLLKYGTKYNPIPIENQLTMANILNCTKSMKGKLYTDSAKADCPDCISQKRVFYNETISPVGPGTRAYDELAVEGELGLIPRWVYKINGTEYIASGCKTIQDLNGILSCGFVPIPGFSYQKC